MTSTKIIKYKYCITMVSQSFKYTILNFVYEIKCILFFFRIQLLAQKIASLKLAFFSIDTFYSQNLK
jgi:hypothetical protein